MVPMQLHWSTANTARLHESSRTVRETPTARLAKKEKEDHNHLPNQIIVTVSTSRLGFVSRRMQ
jgi:hypothetical protein